MTDEQQSQPPAEALPVVATEAAPRPGPWIAPGAPEDQPFCDWLQDISEGKNPFKTQDKAVLREYGRLTVLRRAQEEVNQQLRQATDAVQAAIQNRDRLQARAQQVQGSVGERVETLREIYLEQVPAEAPQANRQARRAVATKTQKNKTKAARRAAS